MKDQETIRITNVEKRRAIIEDLKAEIQRVLQISHFEYCMFQFEQGLEYLKAYTGKQEHPLYTSRLYWAWWRNQWSFRDQEVLVHILQGERMGLCYPLKTRRAIYEANNQGQYLISETYPDKLLLEHSMREEVAHNIDAKPRQYAPKARE